MAAWTDNFIKGLKPREKNYRVFEGGIDQGFCIQVTPRGRKTFEVRYRSPVNGKRRYAKIGTYPAKSLSDAREAARQINADILNGIDPKETGETVDSATRATGTVADLFGHYIEVMRQQGRSSWEEVESALSRNALPILGPTRPAREVTADDIVRALAIIHQRGSATMANRVRSYLHRAWELGIFHDHDPRHVGRGTRFNLPENVVAKVPKDATAESSGERNLSFDEIVTIWRYGPGHWSAPVSTAIRLIILLGQRIEQVIHMARHELDLEKGVWHLAPERTKRGRHHLVPLPPLAIAQLQGALTMFAGDHYVFPQRARYDRQKPMAYNTLTQAVKKTCPKLNMQHWTPRDLRRTWKTRTGELGLPLDIRNRIQDHLPDDTATKHYDRWSYLPEKRAALEMWADELSRRIDG